MSDEMYWSSVDAAITDRRMCAMVNGTPAPFEPLTLDRLKEIHLQLNAILPKIEDLCPNPADIHPETFNALVSMSDVEDPPNYARAYPEPFAGVEVHVRTDVAPGVFHPCTCKKDEAQ